MQRKIKYLLMMKIQLKQN